MTQQNAALVEESAAAADSLREQSGRMAEAIGVFKLSGTLPARAAPAATRPPATPAPRPPVAARPAKAGVAKAPPRPAVKTPAASAPARPAAAPTPPATGDGNWETF